MLLPYGFPHHFNHSRSSNIAGSRLGAVHSWWFKAILGCALQLQLLDKVVNKSCPAPSDIL